jgi:hypothetical protein
LLCVLQQDRANYHMHTNIIHTGGRMASKPTLLGPHLCPRHHGTEKVLKTVYSQFDHPMRLLTQEYFTEFSHQESFKLCIIHILYWTFDMDMSYARRVRTASYSSHTSHSVSHVLYQRTASHSSYILHLTSYTLRLTPYVLRLTPYALHLTPYVLRLTSYTLHLTPYILHLTSYTLRLTPYILHPTSYTLRLTPYALHLTPYILHLTPYILYLISYRILYRVTCIRLVCKTYPWSDASTIRQKL